MLWQALGALSSFTVDKLAAEISHAVIQNQETSHHHHEDHALHMDEPDVPVAHQHTDGASALVGILPTPSRLAVLTQGSSPIVVRFLAHLSPYMEGPLRPPKFLA